MKCEKCGKEHDGSYGTGRFCSISCANSRVKTKEVKKKISDSLKGNVPWNKGNNWKQVNLICKYCNKEFVSYKDRKFCSKECADKGHDNTNTGGYRNGSGMSHNGYYRGIYCGSTYELVWVIYRLDNDLSVERFPGCIEGEGIKYYPDFVENKHIYEMKGFWTELVDKKCELAINNGYTIDVLYKSDLKREFDWVKDNYEYRYLEELYDDSKVTLFTYTCSLCGKEFSTKRKRNTERKYCSQQCAGKSANKIQYNMAR